jgi:hypothetical protein
LLFALALAVTTGVDVAVALTLALRLTVAFWLAVLSQAGSSTASAATAMNPVILRLIFAKSLLTSELKSSSENIRLLEGVASGGP